MLLLYDANLPPTAMARLVEYQAEVDNGGDYPARVDLAKKLFAARSSNVVFRQVREALSLMCPGARRCAYCEDSVGDEVEHIKPKELYPEHVFQWENYVYACGPCNGGKNNKFAIIDGANEIIDITRKRGAPIAAPLIGDAAFINPRAEDPVEIIELELVQTFAFLPREGITALQALRADFTIETLKLNRDVLLEARKNAYGSYRARLHEYVDKRKAGVSTVQLEGLINGIKSMPHPSVWSEIKRQQELIAELSQLFVAAPEALTW